MEKLLKTADEKLQHEIKAAEMNAARELNKLQNIFVVSINHEFRTPLTGIMGFSETILLMLKRGNLAQEKLREYMDLIMQSGGRLTKLLNSTLDVLVLSKGVYLKHESVPVKELAGEVLADLKKAADKKNLTLTNDIREGPTHVKADRDRVRQVLKNLLDNAIKFTERGEVSVYAEDCGDSVKVAIKDSGIGIAENDVKQIFKRFTQLDRTGARAGMGLGLYICESLIKIMGGKIWMESSNGKGTACYFTLPVIGGDPAE